MLFGYVSGRWSLFQSGNSPCCCVEREKIVNLFLSKSCQLWKQHFVVVKTINKEVSDKKKKKAVRITVLGKKINHNPCTGKL